MLDKVIDTLNEANLKDLIKKQKGEIKDLFPDFEDKVKGVAKKGGIRLKELGPTVWTFKIHSGTKDDLWYDAYVKWKNLKFYFKKFVADKSLWTMDKKRIDMRKLADKILWAADVELTDNCKATQYWGSAYILSRPRINAKYGKKEHRRPKIRNPKESGAYCFDERALVLMSDGTYKSIKDVNVGDYVFTHTGTIKQVLSKSSRIADDIYEAKIEGMFDSFYVTGNHEFYVRDINRKCLCGCGKSLKYSNIKYGRVWAFLRKFTRGHAKHKENLLHIGEMLQWKNIEDLDNATLFYSPQINFGEVNNTNPDIARLYGYFLAEGNFLTHKPKKFKTNCVKMVNKNNDTVVCTGMQFTLGVHEKDTFGKDICDIIKKYYNIDAKVRVYNDKRGHSSLIITFYPDIEVVREFMDLMGQGCLSKKLTSGILNLNRLAKIQFLIGAILGDGSITESGYVTYVTANETIAHQMGALLTSLNIKSTIKKFKSTNQTEKIGIRYYVFFNLAEAPQIFTEDFIKHSKRQNLNLTNSKQFEWVYDFDGFFRKTLKIEKTNEVCRVYNLEVEGDNSYIVNGVSVHNCKHLAILMQVIPFYKTTMAKWLKDFYSKEINLVVDEINNKGKKPEQKPVVQQKKKPVKVMRPATKKLV